ncbi:MAG: ArsR/SmtB family transcription factor [Terriglobales bacterium]
MSPRRSSPARAAALERSAPLFAALGDPTRLRLVARLGGEGPLSIARLSAGAGVTRQAVTKHLRVLADAGLAHAARQGRESVWQLDRKRLEDARRHLDLISQQWDTALGRLRAFVEE